jgi:predicted metal-dependent enzyme (double-stranded beta helix superfamily)
MQPLREVSQYDVHKATNAFPEPESYQHVVQGDIVSHGQRRPFQLMT